MANWNHMLRSVLLVAACSLPGITAAQAQAVTWAVRGDTSGGPPGCAAAAIRALDRFFSAFSSADSAGLAQSVAPRFGFSAGKWTPADTFTQTSTIAALSAYARKRARAGERLALQAVPFNYWRHGTELHFGPLVFVRTAPDLGIANRSAMGKGFYECSKGIRALSLGRPGAW